MRTLPAFIQTQIQKGVTKPVFRVTVLSPSGTLYLYSHGTVVAFSGNPLQERTWTGATMEYTEGELRIFDEQGTYNAYFVTQGEIPVLIEYSFGSPTFQVTGEFDALYNGVIAQRTLGDWIVCSLQQPSRLEPHQYVDRTTFPYLPTRGTVIQTPNGIYTLEPYS